MTNRESALAILRYQPYGRLPIVHFGFWGETLWKWHGEGHVTEEEVRGYWDGSAGEASIIGKLGFDFGWGVSGGPHTGLMPGFETKVVEDHGDGSRIVMNGDGVLILQRDGATSIPREIDHTLKDRASWEEHFKPRLQFSAERVNIEGLRRFSENPDRDYPAALYCGSLYGQIRNWLGMEGLCYLMADDEELYTEIIDTVGDLCYQGVKTIIESGLRFDYAHMWEDICFRSGPLVSPAVFREKVGPHYKRITGLVNSAGMDIVSLDCDGCIDALVPVWLENGVNTMFPIEVGVWNASIAPWREQYGKDLRGVGGMNKNVFAEDFAAVDAEVERLKPLVDLGGFIPCPDHRIPPTAIWDNVRYYCDRMRKEFNG